jgi:hypothetical protein
VLAFNTPVRGFKPGRSRRIFKGEKILNTPSFGGQVKLSVLCRRFAAFKRSLNGVEVVTIFSPTVPPSAAGVSCVVADVEHLVAKVGMSKRGGKQWQTTPKNLPRMQHTRGISVAWLSSGLCPDRPKGWIPIVIIIIIIMLMSRYESLIVKWVVSFMDLNFCLKH